MASEQIENIRRKYYCNFMRSHTAKDSSSSPTLIFSSLLVGRQQFAHSLIRRFHSWPFDKDVVNSNKTIAMHSVFGFDCIHLRLQLRENSLSDWEILTEKEGRM